MNAGVTVGSMLRAWEDFGPAIGEGGLNLPATGGKVPMFLSEIRWELEWLLTMQATDGSVYHKVSTKGFGGFILPEKETTERFFVPWSSAATADFVAMMAMAGRSFGRYDPGFSDHCLGAARRSYAFLKAHPEDHPADQRGFKTGGYEAPDPDDRLWAAAELWESTGDSEALADLESRIRKGAGRVDRDWDWGNVGNLGLMTYAFSNRARAQTRSSSSQFARTWSLRRTRSSRPATPTATPDLSARPTTGAATGPSRARS